MSSTTPFQPAHELQRIAGKTSGAVLPDEDADTLPIPVKVDGDVLILIMYYRERGRPGQRVVSPPHYAMHLDGRTGQVLKFWAVVPEDLGIHDPDAVVEGVGIAPGMSPDDFFKKRERLLAISPDVWSAYARGAAPTDPAARPLASEYWTLFAQITKREVAPFYFQASPDFFHWVRAAGSAAAPGQP